MQHELYITNDYDTVYQYAKQKAKDLNINFYGLDGNKEGLDKLVMLHNEHIQGVVFMCDVTKAPIFDVLLPILEKTDLCIILVSDKYDVKQAIISRCRVTYLISNYKREIENFMKKRTLPQDITIDFLCALADEVLKDKNAYNKLCIINDIIRDIQLSTNNILQEELKYRLKEIL